MGFLEKARDLLNKHDDKVDQALDKAGDQVDERTGHKYSEQIDKAVQAAQEHTGEGDTTAR